MRKAERRITFPLQRATGNGQRSYHASVSRHVFITGGSSGIGKELGEELARRGWAVTLVARRVDLVERNAAGLRALGVRAAGIGCDVMDRQSVIRAVENAEEQLGPIDVAVANAGVGLPSPAAKFDVDDAEMMIRTNVLGMMYLFGAVIPKMIERRSGRFVGIASLAGLRGLPATSVYSASKAAMQAFLEASRIDLRNYGIGVTTVNPGFVITPMTEKNRFQMPFLMPVDRAVRIIADGIERGAREVEFPRPLALLTRLSRLLPNAVYERLSAPYARREMDASKMKR
jgi:short-subunit dehydrogenase